MAGTPLLLHHLLENSAATRPEAEALVDGERRLTHAQLLAAAQRCAGVLARRGLARRDRVAVYLPKSVEEVVALFGASLAGGVFVPVNPLLRARQVEHIVSDCGVRFLVTSAARWKELRETLGPARTLEHVLLVDGPADGDPRVSAQALDEDGPAARAPACIGEDLAAVLYTSGSTGRPKGVMLSHRNLLAGSRIVCRYVGIRPEERILSVLPFSFDYGLNQLVTAVDQGAALVLLTFRFGDEIVRALRDHRVTGLAGVPTLWAVLTQAAPSLPKTELPHLRYLTNSGGAVPTEIVRKLRAALPRASIFLMYGLTEAFRSTYLPPVEIDRRPTSIGKAIPETEILVVREDGEPAGPGETGILVHRGPTVSLGYWGRPEDTAAVLRPHPFLPPAVGGETVCYSGDLVRTDEEGFLYFVGRRDAMIKSSGYRVSPTEVEEVLMATGRLAQAAVVGLPDPATGARIHAVVVARPGEPEAAEEVLAFCAKELPPHMVPRAVEYVPELPRSPNGKVDHQRLRAERLPGEARA